MKMHPDFENQSFTSLTKDEIINFLVMKIAYMVGNTKRIIFRQLAVYYDVYSSHVVSNFNSDSCFIVGTFAIDEVIKNYQIQLTDNQIECIYGCFSTEVIKINLIDQKTKELDSIGEATHYVILT